MSQTRLSLEAPITANSCILRLQDTSSYNVDITPKCPQLQVTVPGFKAIYIDNVTLGFSLNLTACDLKIQTINCGQVYNDLPDGVYIVRYSISPNDIVYVEYNVYRQTKALNKLKALYCDLDLDQCEPSSQKKKMQQDAAKIFQYLEAAKALVEDCRQVHKGIEVYKLAMKMLDKHNCKGCH